ncbi:MAG TPA: hypothetical protein PLX89_02235 [Verrucomicrobiota bacterium]|nr:hypothetical protein [Verrucomicrobiales bacterium]HRI11797.1 hypothetical protein [Verrucomicrobiota bacterium]
MAPRGKLRDPDDRPIFLPRLAREQYQGDAIIHWSLPIFDRTTGWLNDTFHGRFRELMQHTAAREGLICPVYCLMPDHLHLIWMGLRRDTDQKNGMAFLRTHLEPELRGPKFQPQAHDHVLRDNEKQQIEFARACFYIFANPLRAGLVNDCAHWAYSGSVVPGYPRLHPLEPEFWNRFWRIYARARQPDAGEIRRPL